MKLYFTKKTCIITGVLNTMLGIIVNHYSSTTLTTVVGWVLIVAGVFALLMGIFDKELD